jgi:uncharacterized protein
MNDHPTKKTKALIGIISDTHGYLSTSAIQSLKGVDRIIHAGDIGNPEVLDTLNRIAPVDAVRGNMDGGKWAKKLPKTEIVEIGDILIYVLHDINDLDLDPSVAGIGAIINGHTHQPAVDRRNGVLYVNPGSASMPRRSSESIAHLSVSDTEIRARIIALPYKK